MPKLDWLTRAEDERVAASVPYRLLEAVPELGYAASGDDGAQTAVEGMDEQADLGRQQADPEQQLCPPTRRAVFD